MSKYVRPRSEILATLAAFDRVCREKGISRPTEFDRETIYSFIEANNARLAEVPGLGSLAVVFPMWMVAGHHSVQLSRGVYDPQWHLLDEYLLRYPEIATVDDRAQERSELALVEARRQNKNRREAAERALKIAQIRATKVLPDIVADAVSDDDDAENA
jgi:hypothetical protein